jgi:phosphomethylpyrimidine synthase
MINSRSTSTPAFQAGRQPLTQLEQVRADVDTDFCAMCGHDWCAVRISREIVEFASGKDAASQPDRAAEPSAALTPEQVGILERRGNLSAEEIRRLARKGRKLACHSDEVGVPAQARRVQKALLGSQ